MAVGNLGFGPVTNYAVGNNSTVAPVALIATDINQDGFPDLVTAQVTETGPSSSSLTLYSRSVYGHSDLGVNRQRLVTWLAAVQTSINHTGER